MEKGSSELTVDGLVITGSLLPTAEPSEVRLPVMVIMSALAVWLKREMVIAPTAAIGIRTFVRMKPPHFYLRRRNEKVGFGGRFFWNRSADFVPVLGAGNLPLDERMIRQLAVPMPP